MSNEHGLPHGYPHGYPVINGERLWQTLMRSGEIGPGRPGGLSRLALSDADQQMRDQFVEWCRRAGLDVAVDRVGNIFGRRAGTEPNLPPVLIGSHLDTQVAGGKFDGILGVLAGLEVVRVLNEHNISTRRAIEIVCWTNEEGARFQPPMLCSGAFAGYHDVDWVLAREDDEGNRFGDELQRIGYAGSAPVGGRQLDSYFELHIEQGDELERAGINVGVVVGGYSTKALEFEIRGETAHTGPTPMDRRRNALVGAAMLIVAANEIGWAHHPPGKSTSNRISVWPNKPGILPDYAKLTIDFRHPDPAVTAQMERAIHEAAVVARQRANVDIEVVNTWAFGEEKFDPECASLLRKTAQRLGYETRDILSQAGHDAYRVSLVAPTAMIFTPCRGGISHNEKEHIELDYTLPGANVLLHAVIERANR